MRVSQPTIRHFAGAVIFLFTLFINIPLPQDGWSSVACAQTSSDRSKRIFLVPFKRVDESVPSSLVSRSQSFIRTLLTMQSELRLLRADGTSAREDGAEESLEAVKVDPVIQKARDLYLRGKTAAESGRWHQAVRYLERSLAQYEKHVATLTNFNALVENTLWLARARYGVGQARQGDVLIRKTVAYRPEYIVDTSNESPAFIEAFNRIRTQVINDRAGDVIVTCLVGECMIFVDGVPRGTGTVAVSGLRSGTHFVKATAPGHTTWSMRIQAPPKGQTRELLASVRRARERKPAIRRAMTTKIPIEPEILEPFVEQGDFRSRFLANARKFCRQRRVDYLLVGVLNSAQGGHALALFLYSQKFHAFVPVSQTLIEAGSGNLQTQLIVSKNRVLSAMKRFPSQRRIIRRPAIYKPYKSPKSRVTSVAKAEVPTLDTVVLPPPEAPEMDASDATDPKGPIVPIYRPQPVYDPSVDDTPIYQPAPVFEPVKTAVRPMIRPSTPFTVLERSVVVEATVKTEWYGTWWFWTAVGVVVAGSVTAGIVLGMPEAGSGGWSATVQLP